MYRVGQNRICTRYMTVYLVIFLPNYRIYTVYIWFWPTLVMYLNLAAYLVLEYESGFTVPSTKVAPFTS